MPKKNNKIGTYNNGFEWCAYYIDDPNSTTFTGKSKQSAIAKLKRKQPEPK